MSSHHIIRENQEPALVLLTEIEEDLLTQLCEWNPSIYCHYSILDWVDSIQLKVDTVFGPQEKESAVLERLNYQMPVSYRQETELKSLLASIDNASIHLAGDEAIKNLLEFPMKEVIHFSDSFKAYSFEKNWRKWKNAGEIVRIESENTLQLINLEEFENNKFKVTDSGKCEVTLSGRAVIYEYH